jgi:small subunit ribosomal protein S7
MMRTENYNGKKTKAYKAVRGAFEIIDKKTKSNPMQVFIDALQNAAPKEETTRLKFGGISVPKAVDVAPQRRLDIAIRNICQGAVNTTHNNKKRIESCLADEIIKASKNDTASFAVAKKNDVERVAKSAR